MNMITLLSITVSSALFLIVLELVRRGRLKERYSLLWLFATVVLILLSGSRSILEYLSHVTGIHYAPSFLFLTAFLFLLLITLHFSIEISSLSLKNKKLAQELSLLRQEVLEGLAKAEQGKHQKA